MSTLINAEKRLSDMKTKETLHQSQFKNILKTQRKKL